MSQLDLGRRFGLIGGDIFHGALTLDQLFSARPMPGYADLRAPLAGLYICGRTRIQAVASPAPSGHIAADAASERPDAGYLVRLWRWFLQATCTLGVYSCVSKNSATVYSSGLSPRQTKSK
jgi:hypothetical protein